MRDDNRDDVGDLGAAGRVRSPGGARIPSGACRAAVTRAVEVCAAESGAQVQLVLVLGGERTWTVVDDEHRLVVSAEEYLDYLRVLGRSPNERAGGPAADGHPR